MMASLRTLAGGSSFEEIMADYHLTDEQIRAALNADTSVGRRTDA